MFTKTFAIKSNFSRKRAFTTATPTNYFHIHEGVVKTSKLANGVTVISKSGEGVNCSLGLFVRAGSAFETPQFAGASLLLKGLTLKSTINTSGLRVTRFLESITQNFHVDNGRETIEYHANFFRPDVEDLATTFAELQSPRVAEWELRDTIEELKKEVANPRPISQRVYDAIYFQAFKGQGVGRPTHSPQFASRTQGDVLEYAALHRQGSIRSLVGVGIDHETLHNAAEAFSYLPVEKPINEPKWKYFGGELFEENLTYQVTHYAVAFPAASEHIVALRVAAALLDTHFCNQSPTDASGFGLLLDGSNGGGSYPFFGVLIQTYYTNTKVLANQGAMALGMLVQNLTEEQLAMAVKAAKVKFVSELEDAWSLKNYLYYYQSNPADLLVKFDAVDMKSFKEAVTSTLSVNPTVVCIGDLTGLTSFKL